VQETLIELANNRFRQAESGKKQKKSKTKKAATEIPTKAGSARPRYGRMPTSNTAPNNLP